MSLSVPECAFRRLILGLHTRRAVNSWGCRFAVQCVAEVAARALAAEPPTYATILELDRKVREFPIPPEVVALLEDLRAPSEDEEPESLTKSMERMVLSHCREVGTSPSISISRTGSHGASA